MSNTDTERLKRWRLVLGDASDESIDVSLDKNALRMDSVLEALYDSDRKGGLGSSSPNVTRWLGDIRAYFPSSVVRVMQKDALSNLKLNNMLLEPEMLAEVDADVNLVATLLTLKGVIPNRTKETARQVVRKVVDELEKKLRNPMMEAIRGSLNRAVRNQRPRAGEVDWHRTINKNLKNYIPEKKTIIAQQIVGYGHRRSSLNDIILCVDQSGSMASSVIYSSIFGAVLASMRAVSSKMVLFDTSVVDLTEELQDPVDLLFGAQLGGGTDINQALAYCQGLVERPSKTIMVLITDLYEGGNERDMLKRAGNLVQSGVNLVCLLALSDTGTPFYNKQHAKQFSALGIPTFAVTPDLFPDLMATAIQRQDIGTWAARNEIIAIRGE